MDREPTYGAVFVKHLTKLGKHVPYNYNDLQQVKTMSQAELADSDVRLECTSQRPNCQRKYHPLCVGRRFGHLYRAKDLTIPQPEDSKWRCMVCSDVCAVCAPAAKIEPNEPFYRCGCCGSKAHQRHWSAGGRRDMFLLSCVNVK